MSVPILFITATNLLSTTVDFHPQLVLHNSLEWIQNLGWESAIAFILIYILFIVFVGLPVLMSEYIIGRAGQASSAVKSMDDLNDRGNTSRGWSSGAWLGMIASFLIVSFYCVVAAWVLAYIPKFLTGAFEGQNPEQIAGQFGELVSTPTKVIPYFVAFGILTAFLVSRGVNRGIG